MLKITARNFKHPSIKTHFELREDVILESEASFSWTADRKDVKQALAHKKQSVRVYIRYYHEDGPSSTGTPMLFMATSKTIRIGCMVFAGKNFEVLKKWADSDTHPQGSIGSSKPRRKRSRRQIRRH